MFFSSTTLGHVSIYVMFFYNQLLYPSSNILPQFSSPDRFASVLPFGPLPTVAVANRAEHLPPSTSHCRGKVLVIFLVQQHLKAAGQLSPLQTGSIHLVLQQFLRLDWCDTVPGALSW